MERNIVKSLEIFENRFGTGVVTSVLIQSIAIEEVLSQLPDIHAGRNVIALWNSGASQNRINVVMRQLASITKPSWMRSFLARHRSAIRKSKVGRALERHEAAKHQIELVLAHLRNVYQAEAFAQIQRFIARTGQMVPGFVRFEGIVQREEQSEIGLPDSLLDVRDGQLYVTVLNEPLEHVDAGKRFALDETPIVPDSPILRAYTVHYRAPLSRGRASMWTLWPFLCANGNVIASLLLQRCLSLTIDEVKFTSSYNDCVGATENSQQSDDSWLKFAEVWLLLCGASWEDPGFVYLDGHISHITHSFIQMAANHSIYVVVEPSHTSIILQVADLGINRFLKDQYGRDYTSGLCTTNVTGRIFDDTERIGCVVRALHAMKSRPELIVHCFTKSGLLSGYRDVAQHFPPRKFSAGVSLRYINLPQVNNRYDFAVLSLANLADKRGAPVTIPEHLISEEQRSLESYTSAGDGFRRFYFALGASAKTRDNDNEIIELGFQEASTGVETEVRKLFKLGRDVNVPRGAPGRISTAYGSLASARDHFEAALRAEEIARESMAAKEARLIEKAVADDREKSLVDALVSARFMNRGERLVKRTLTKMLESNSELMKELGLALSSSRATIVDALLNRLQKGSLTLEGPQHVNE